MIVAAALTGLVIGLSGLAQAADSALPVPRFVSLRSDEVNVRTGPGVRYPIDWVFQRKTMPVEVLAEVDTWRKVRAADGTEGWVHQSMLTGRRTAMVTGRDVLTLRKRNASDADAVAMLEPGVIGNLLECRDAWCRLEIAGNKGWLPRDTLWGVLPSENFN
ncbi:MAG: SH3 domain-containing protein [Alphaproteobacteria bacterium]|nr:SH3 domain-containing protein [Alphaproteobacteria bacterium]